MSLTENNHLCIGITGLYSDGDNGELTVTKNGRDFQLKLYKQLQSKLSNDVSTFSKLATPEIRELEAASSG
jgi:hypothetical protein